MTEGFITLHRQVTHKGFWKNPSYAHLWVHILLKANWQETEVLWNGEIIKLKPGQFITGRDALASETGLHRSLVERALKLFEIEHQIEQQKNNRFRLITVKKWSDYQDKRAPNRASSEHPASIQRAQTTKKPFNKATRDTGGEAHAAPPPPTPREDAIDFFKDPDVRQPIIDSLVQRGTSLEAVTREIEKFVLYWTEPTANGKRQRWETERTFEVKRRLFTWLQRASKDSQRNTKPSQQWHIAQ